MVYYIPNGPKNLKSIISGIDFKNVEEYYVEVYDESGAIVATTPLNKLGCCCNSDENIRVHFLNYLGTFDAVNFNKPIITHEPVSSLYKNALPVVHSKTDTGFERLGVKANDTKIAKNQCYAEQHMTFIQELIDSPKAFEEWRGKQGQLDNYLPIIITDKKFEKQKNEREYNYDFTIEFKMSNEIITIRN